MWFKVSEELYIPAGELVGFFSPEALPPERPGAQCRSVALMSDGAVLPMPFTLKSMAARYAAAAKQQGARLTASESLSPG